MDVVVPDKEVASFSEEKASILLTTIFRKKDTGFLSAFGFGENAKGEAQWSGNAPHIKQKGTGDYLISRYYFDLGRLDKGGGLRVITGDVPATGNVSTAIVLPFYHFTRQVALLLLGGYSFDARFVGVKVVPDLTRFKFFWSILKDGKPQPGTSTVLHAFGSKLIGVAVDDDLCSIQLYISIFYISISIKVRYVGERLGNDRVLSVVLNGGFNASFVYRNGIDRVWPAICSVSIKAEGGV